MKKNIVKIMREHIKDIGLIFALVLAGISFSISLYNNPAKSVNIESYINTIENYTAEEPILLISRNLKKGDIFVYDWAYWDWSFEIRRLHVCNIPNENLSILIDGETWEWSQWRVGYTEIIVIPFTAYWHFYFWSADSWSSINITYIIINI